MENRQEFMNFFRDDKKLNTLTPDDRVEVFKTILLGDSDVTSTLLREIVSDYCVEDIEIMDVCSDCGKLISDEGYFENGKCIDCD